MAKKVSAVKRKLAKGKSWYKILAPAIFRNVEVGEALSSNPDNLKNRIINVQYSTVSGDVTKHFLKTRLRINKIEGNKAYTEFLGYEMAKPYLQRLIKRRSSKIDEVIDLKLQDKNVRLKVTATTLRKANSSQRTALRKAIRAEILKNLREYTFENLATTLASGKPQKMIHKKIRIIFPVRFFDVRKIEILPERKVKADFGKEKIEEVAKKEPKKAGKKIKTEAKEEKPKIVVKETPEPKEKIKEEA